MRKVLKNKRVLTHCHIYQMLLENAKRKHTSFHTPGHKQGKWDITELSFSDNLSCPHGCIAAAQADIARILGADSSFILTDGSTAGVLSLLFAAKTLGVKRVAACQAAHKSFFNGCKLTGITPMLFAGRTQNGIPCPITVDELAALDADALFITSPDYYGNVADLAAIRAYCDQTGKLLLIDGAHGGHLHVDKALYAGTYADMWVDGVHKSLPALTQGAVVSAKTARCSSALAAAVDIFRTTSPSYPIMASVEYAVKYPQNARLQRLVREFAKETERVRCGDDWTKLFVLFGKYADEAHERLQKDGIFAEFCDGNGILFYLSPATDEKTFLTLQKRLIALFKAYPYQPQDTAQSVHTPCVLQKCGEVEWVDIDKAVGRICAANCGLFPPCTPLILAGERVSEETAARLKRADNVFGLKNYQISVFKDTEKE